MRTPGHCSTSKILHNRTLPQYLSDQMLQDTQDPNPLIRALAVRTMGCIRVDKITEYLCDPLQRCLKVRWCHDSHHTNIKLALNAFPGWNSDSADTAWLLQDDDPYVRKTAAVCVAKLHDINSELVEDRGFLDTLKVRYLSSECDLFMHGVNVKLMENTGVSATLKTQAQAICSCMASSSPGGPSHSTLTTCQAESGHRLDVSMAPAGPACRQ